jgi:hypothetical protein
MSEGIEMTSRTITRLLVALVAAFGLIAGSVSLAGAQSNERAEEAQSNGTDGNPPCDAGEAGDNNPSCADGEFQRGSQDAEAEADEIDNGEEDNGVDNDDENDNGDAEAQAQAHNGTDGNPPCDAGRAGEMNPNCVDGEFQRGPQDAEAEAEETGEAEAEENGDGENGEAEAAEDDENDNDEGDDEEDEEDE